MTDKIFPKIHDEGYKFVTIFIIVTIILYFIHGFLGFVGLVLTIWCYYFFRDPERITIGDDNYLTSPADGIVLQVLETNVDDVSGEVLGNLIEKLMLNGAKDVTITPGITKKGRPTHLISVICDSASMQQILELLVEETRTLGVRVRTSERFVVPRTIDETMIEIDGREFLVHYKKADNTSRFKIEFDDIKSISDSLNFSFNQTEELLREKIKKKNG